MARVTYETCTKRFCKNLCHNAQSQRVAGFVSVNSAPAPSTPRLRMGAAGLAVSSLIRFAHKWLLAGLGSEINFWLCTPPSFSSLQVSKTQKSQYAVSRFSVLCAPARTRTWNDGSEDRCDIHFTTGAIRVGQYNANGPSLP